MRGRTAALGVGLALGLAALGSGCGPGELPPRSAAACEERLGSLRRALVDLDRRVYELGYDAYEARVSDLKVLWQGVDVRALEEWMPECWAVAHAGWDAVAEYAWASDLWTECHQDVRCRFGETEQPLLFENWQRAAGSVAAMRTGLERMKLHPTNDTCPAGTSVNGAGYCSAR